MGGRPKGTLPVAEPPIPGCLGQGGLGLYKLPNPVEVPMRRAHDGSSLVGLVAKAGPCRLLAGQATRSWPLVARSPGLVDGFPTRQGRTPQRSPRTAQPHDSQEAPAIIPLHRPSYLPK